MNEVKAGRWLTLSRALFVLAVCTTGVSIGLLAYALFLR